MEGGGVEGRVEVVFLANTFTDSKDSLEPNKTSQRVNMCPYKAELL